MSKIKNILKVGDTVHGFAGGMFGRDSYDCRTVEEIGPDWALLRDEHGTLELLTDRDGIPSWFTQHLEPGSDQHCACVCTCKGTNDCVYCWNR